MKDIKEQSKGFINEFKEFIQRGNVVDLAVGVIVGNAFSKIVTSLTENILMPIIGLIIGGLDFSRLGLKLSFWGKTLEIRYGAFIQTTFDFLITAFCIFLVIKLMSAFRKKEEEKVVEPVVSDEVKLLEEIRDLLKKKTK